MSMPPFGMRNSSRTKRNHPPVVRSVVAIIHPNPGIKRFKSTMPILITLANYLKMKLSALYSTEMLSRTYQLYRRSKAHRFVSSITFLVNASLPAPEAALMSVQIMRNLVSFADLFMRQDPRPPPIRIPETSPTDPIEATRATTRTVRIRIQMLDLLLKVRTIRV